MYTFTKGKGGSNRESEASAKSGREVTIRAGLRSRTSIFMSQDLNPNGRKMRLTP